MENINILYFSATGTTAKIVKEIAKGMGKISMEYDITLPVNRQKEMVFNSNDLVIIGVPVYVGRVPGFLIDYFAKIKGNNTKAVFITVYGNRDYDDALLELKDTFEKRGFIGVAAGAFIGEHSNTTKVATGRPDKEDLGIALKFGMEIKEKLDNWHAYVPIKRLEVKGNFPYKERVPKPPMIPETDDKCIKCGVCAQYCPMDAIDFNNFTEIDAAKCIRCSSCVKKCPVNAKSIKHEEFISFTKWLIDNCGTVRKEPELFV